MLVKTTIKEIIETIVTGNEKPTNNTICGRCSKCGECCTNFLPVSQNEIDTIQKYVIQNNIKPQMQMLVMQNRLCCPYYNGQKCLIYDVRPLICKEFFCNKTMDMYKVKKFENDKYITVDMWAIAKEIEKDRSKYNARTLEH